MASLLTGEAWKSSDTYLHCCCLPVIKTVVGWDWRQFGSVGNEISVYGSSLFIPVDNKDQQLFRVG